MLGNEDRMKISTKGRYAVRVMLDLALNNNGECIKVKEIAARQGISEKYLEQIIAVLNKAGYVKSVRGAQGGYRIAKDPADYTVGMILRLTEGSLAPVACLEDGADICERCDTCETLEVWQELYNAVNKVVDGVTIADLVERRKRDWRIWITPYSMISGSKDLSSHRIDNSPAGFLPGCCQFAENERGVIPAEKCQPKE